VFGSRSEKSVQAPSLQTRLNVASKRYHLIAERKCEVRRHMTKKTKDKRLESREFLVAVLSEVYPERRRSATGGASLPFQPGLNDVRIVRPARSMFAIRSWALGFASGWSRLANF
jgi:hypothetical protein